MRLNAKELENREQWEKAGVELPRFDRNAMIKATKEQPQWVHIGAGNIFRAFLVALQQSLLDQGLEKTGIIAAAGYDAESVDLIYRPHDNLVMSVTLKTDGSIKKQALASIAEALRLDKEADVEHMKNVFRDKSLQMVSFTITEKGYSLTQGGKTLPEVEADFNAGPKSPKNYIGKVTSLCYERYLAGKFPLALVSMDNCSHNGDILFKSVEAFAVKWAEKGLVESAFVDYIRDPSKVSFPWTMIDKITPGPDAGVLKMLENAGIEGMAGEKNSFGMLVSPFVNAEEAQYLVVEDKFPNGRPCLEKAGVFFTDQATVDKVEKMKVCTCLNPLHTALAVFGCLLGYTKINEEMKNPDLVKLVEGVGYKEGLPVVVDPGIVSPKKFIDEVLQVRLPNPFMPDAPQRIASDTSQKVGIRFGETIKAYQASPNLDVKDLHLIPLVLAGWIRYLLGVDDKGEAFTVSPDPLYETLSKSLSGIKLGQKGPFHETLKPILSDAKIFGVDLYAAGLGERVEHCFEELVAGPGAVAACLRRPPAGYSR